jgi:WD40 repeat protein
MSIFPAPVEVFYSYADADESLRIELEKHLSLLRHERLITTWHQRQITAGTNRSETIDEHLNKASIILLLISSDFVASDYCYGIELQRALERHNAGEARVIPILLRPVDNWQGTPFGKLQALPRSGIPITLWHNRDAAFADIVQGIRAVLGYGPASRSMLFMVEDLPAHFVQRPDVFEPLIRSLLAEKREEPVAITAALRGAGGYGKTTLARALCHDERVQEAFDAGILWVTLGERPDNLVNKVEELIYALSHEKVGFTSLEAATIQFAELLADRAILLVIDDVWNSAHLKPFLQGGKRCVRLITTRDERVIPPLATRIQVDAMQMDEAIQLLIGGISGFDDPAFLKQNQDVLQRLAKRLGEWPLLLTLARSVLQERITLYQQDVTRALTALHRILDKRGLIAFDMSDAVERSQAVAKTLQISFDLLRSSERIRYQELAIFPEDVDIPLQTIQRLWTATGSLDDYDTEELCIRFRNLSLLLHYNAVTQTIRLHDVIRTYLQYQFAPAELTRLHSQFLDAYGITQWADLPRYEPYLWDHLATHLIAAGRNSELLTTVTDGAYLATKAHYRPVSMLEHDLTLVITEYPENTILHPLKHSIVNMAHLLSVCNTFQECASVLHSRLVRQPDFLPVCQSLEKRLISPYLTAWHPLPDLPTNALMRTLVGHTDAVRACAISPDGSWLVSASRDHTLKLWDIVTGQERLTLYGHTNWVNACAISPDGSWLVSASSDHTLKLWDIVTGQERLTLHGHTDSVNACTISPDGTWLVSASRDHTLKLWDTITGQERLTLHGHTDSVNACAISPDGTWLVSASRDHTLKLWDTITGQERLTLHGHTHWVNACTISPDGTWLVSASSDHTLKLWDAVTGQERLTLYGHTNWVHACAVSPDGSWLVSGSRDHTLKLWDTITGQERLTLYGHTHRVTASALSPDGSWLVSGSRDHTLKLWNIITEQAQHELSSHTNWVTASTISSDGSWLVSASSDHTLKLWDIGSGQLRHTLRGHTNWVNDCAISSDGSWLVSASSDHTLKIWDIGSGQERLTLYGHTDWISVSAISPDGTWFVSASYDKTLKLWNAVTGQERYTLHGHTNWVNACAISPDGTWLVSASADSTLKIWEAATGQERHTLQGHNNQVRACAISPDGTWLVSASADSTLKIWDIGSGQERHTLHGHHNQVRACAISPDGTWLVSASDDKTLKLWDSATGQERYTLYGHSNQIRACAISPEGTWLVSASNDQTLRLWDIPATREVQTFHANGELRGCKFCVDWKHIIATGARGVYFLRVA